jgi:hypothetical protein
MIATLAVVVTLGVLVTIVITNGTPSTPQTHVTGGAGGSTSTTGSASIGTDTKAAAISGCVGNFNIVLSAVSDYETLNGGPPPAGSAWATSATGGPILQSWPSDPEYYTLEWNGSELSVIPKHGTPSHGNVGTTSPPTGCHAA